MPADFLDRYSRGDTICHRLPPRLKSVAVLIVVLVALLAERLVPLLSSAAGREAGESDLNLWPVYGCLASVIFLALSLAQIPVRYLLVRLLFFFPMMGMLSIAIPASNYFASGWDFAALLLLRGTLSFLAVVWLVNVTPFDKLLASVRGLGVPRLLVAMLAFMYRYSFVVFDELQRMRAARKARSFGEAGLGTTWKSHAQLIGMLLIRSMDRAERVHGAMLSRGWDGEIRTLD